MLWDYTSTLSPVSSGRIDGTKKAITMSNVG